MLFSELIVVVKSKVVSEPSPVNVSTCTVPAKASKWITSILFVPAAGAVEKVKVVPLTEKLLFDW